MKAGLEKAKEIIANLSEQQFLYFMQSILHSRELALKQKASRHAKVIAKLPRIPHGEARFN